MNAVCVSRQYLGYDFDWSKLGPRQLKDVNNFELTEWLIGNGVTLRFEKSVYFPHAYLP
jgi:hypothetical protein